MSRLKATILRIDDHWNGLMGRKMLLENNGMKSWRRPPGTKD